MGKQYVRFALMQMFLVFIVILWVGFALKTRLVPLPPTAFPVLVRNYGFLLLLLPAAWCTWAVLQSQCPTHDTRAEAIIGAVGVALCLFLLCLGWFTAHAAWSAPIYQAVPQPTPESSPSPISSQ